MASLALRRLRVGLAVPSLRNRDDVRGVGIRLAAQTVGLLLMMLVVIEVAVYVTTERSLRSALETTLKTRAQLPGGLGGPCPPGAPCSPGDGPPAGFGTFRGGRGITPGGFDGRRFQPDRRNPSEASFAFIDRSLTVRDKDGPHSSVVLDRSTARRVIASGQDVCCTTASYEDQNYLVYTRPVQSDGLVVGAIQTSISLYQYDQTKRTLLERLVAIAFLGLFFVSGISTILVRRALDPIRTAMQRQRDFVADAAHELRTPLAIQRTVAEVALTEPAGANDSTVEQMLVENRHLTRLVDDLSLLARADSNAATVNRAPMNLSSLVQETTSELEPLAEEQGVRIVCDVIPGVTVSGDIMRLRQLLLVLLDNALKFTPDGGSITVSLRSQGGRAELAVADTGPGIDPADLPHIFDRFYRADRARTGEGSGLGLAIARWIAQAHSGQITAHNAAPHGAVFSVSLPLARAS